MNDKAYIQHVLRVGGACICLRCEAYRSRVAPETAPERRDPEGSAGVVRGAVERVVSRLVPR
jgi:hypothetical protein